MLQPNELVELCLSLAKYKRDNKAFLGYLLFEANNKIFFTNSVKSEIDEHFQTIDPQQNLYYVKKGLRKLLRTLGKYSKFTGDKAFTADVLIYFCSKLKNSGIPYQKSPLLVNLYAQQLKKINSLVDKFHEDLKLDYIQEIEKISN